MSAWRSINRFHRHRGMRGKLLRSFFEASVDLRVLLWLLVRASHRAHTLQDRSNVKISAGRTRPSSVSQFLHLRDMFSNSDQDLASDAIIQIPHFLVTIWTSKYTAAFDVLLTASPKYTRESGRYERATAGIRERLCKKSTPHWRDEVTFKY